MAGCSQELVPGVSVAWQGRRCVLRGLDPMSMAQRRAELEDVETGERLTVLLSELSDAACGCG